jgi:hypothetical protein
MPSTEPRLHRPDDAPLGEWHVPGVRQDYEQERRMQARQGEVSGANDFLLPIEPDPPGGLWTKGPDP